MMKKMLAVILLLSSAASAVASVETLQLVGEARLKVMFWSVYDSRLYTKDGDYYSGQKPLRFEIEYLRDIDASKLVMQTEREWSQQGMDHPSQSKWLKTLGQLWPSVTKGDVISLHLDERGYSTFYANGELLGRINDADFGANFLGIWLSPDTTRPKLRNTILGTSPL